jgi:2-phosphosulfolactate phosphatase
MYIDVVFNPYEFKSRDPIGKSITVIDVLRATTSIAYAFWGYRGSDDKTPQGANKIIPVETLDEALELHGKINGDDILLTGERFCLKPKDFDLGNSPNTYLQNIVQGKTLIYTTTNGTRALKLSEGAKFITTSSFVNASKSAQVLFEQGNDVIVFCAGRSNKTTIEDSSCAGLIVSLLVDMCKKDNIPFELSDGADIAMTYYQQNKDNLLFLLQKAEAGQNLIEVGLEQDIEDCVKVDFLPFATKFENGTITLL